MAAELGGHLERVCPRLFRLCAEGVTNDARARRRRPRSGLSIAEMPSTASPPCDNSHVPSPTTGQPALIPRAISLRVPHAPPTATIASAARTMSALRASPRPVGTATSTQPLASPRSRPGSSPTVLPPARARAPARGLHHAAEPAADQHRAGRRDLGADLLGRRELVRARAPGPDDRDPRPPRRHRTVPTGRRS